MEKLSSTYGWTPNQIRNQRVDDIHKYFEILDMKARLQKREIRKNK